MSKINLLASFSKKSLFRLAKQQAQQLTYYKTWFSWSSNVLQKLDEITERDGKIERALFIETLDREGRINTLGGVAEGRADGDDLGDSSATGPESSTNGLPDVPADDLP